MGTRPSYVTVTNTTSSRSHSLRAPSWRTIQITIVVADDTMLVEHPGNAERPHAAVNRPIARVHRPSGWSRSYVLASLRALHLMGARKRSVASG